MQCRKKRDKGGKTEGRRKKERQGGAEERWGEGSRKMEGIGEGYEGQRKDGWTVSG